ncbi:metallophosphoesterase [Shigella flexneri]
MKYDKYKPIRYFDENRKGKDYVIGDIHGEFVKLISKLREIKFDTKKDRLFCVGDLTDRGPDSHLVMNFLNEDWFISVKGNHELLTIEYVNKMDALMKEIYIEQLGGFWVKKLTTKQMVEIANAYKNLPIAMHVKTEDGPIVIVHADLPTATWKAFEQNMKTVNYKIMMKAMKDTIRPTIKNQYIKDVRAVICGHMKDESVRKLGNFYLIDTGGGFSDGHLTILDMKTLKEV